MQKNYNNLKSFGEVKWLKKYSNAIIHNYLKSERLRTAECRKYNTMLKEIKQMQQYIYYDCKYVKMPQSQIW